MAVERSDELERLLDEAVASYAGAEPRAGIELRVSARVASARRWPIRMFAGVSVVVAAIASVLVISLPPIENMPIVPLPLPVAAFTMPPKVIASAKERPNSVSFPSPAPLSPEEKAWMIAAEKGAVTGIAKDIEPIQIEALTVPLLESEGGE